VPDDDLVIVIDGWRTISLTVLPSPDTSPPEGSFPEAVAVFETVPASTSAWVRV